MFANGGNMISWAFWNTNLSIYYTVYLIVKCSFLPLSAQFFILRVTQRNYYFYVNYFIVELDFHKNRLQSIFHFCPDCLLEHPY